MNDLNRTNETNGLNGGNLPAEREAVIEQAQRVYQTVAHERDTLQRRLNDALSDIAGYKVALEAHASQQAMRDSHMASLQAERDDAVARRASLEAVLASILAVLRTFQIEHEPMVKAQEWHDDKQAITDAFNRAGPQSTGL
jgi:chromosome segregation ATPase